MFILSTRMGFEINIQTGNFIEKGVICQVPDQKVLVYKAEKGIRY